MARIPYLNHTLCQNSLSYTMARIPYTHKYYISFAYGCLIFMIQLLHVHTSHVVLNNINTSMARIPYILSKPYPLPSPTPDSPFVQSYHYYYYYHYYYNIYIYTYLYTLTIYIYIYIHIYSSPFVKSRGLDATLRPVHRGPGCPVRDLLGS